MEGQTKRCSGKNGCGKVLQLSAFSKDKGFSDNLNIHCKACASKNTGDGCKKIWI